MILSVYFVKMDFLFLTNMILTFCQKSKDDLLPKNIYLRMTFLVSLKKYIFILENVVFLLIEKLKMIKRFIFIKMLLYKKVIFCTFTVHVLLSNEQKKKGNVIYRIEF